MLELLMSMNVGFDLDEIFITHPPFVPGWVIEELYRGKKDGKLAYRIPGKIEQRIRILSHIPLFRPQIRKNIEFAHQLAKKKNVSLFLISSRFGFLENSTRKVMKQYGLDGIFQHSYFNFNNKQPHVFKNEMIKKLKIDRFVDDDLYLLQFLAKENGNVLFYWLNGTKQGKMKDNLIAISSLSQIS